VTNDIETLITALYVKIDNGWEDRDGRAGRRC
jgi:hypothetical protein